MPAKRMGSGRIQKLKEHDDRIEKVEKVLEKVTHVIHTDGTYSNDHNTQPFDREKIKHYAFLRLSQKGDDIRVRVRDVNEKGVWTKPADQHYNPPVEECRYWSWAEMERCFKEVL